MLNRLIIHWEKTVEKELLGNVNLQNLEKVTGRYRLSCLVLLYQLLSLDILFIKQGCCEFYTYICKFCTLNDILIECHESTMMIKFSVTDTYDYKNRLIVLTGVTVDDLTYDGEVNFQNPGGINCLQLDPGLCVINKNY